MTTTKIEWTEATWNPSIGCSKVTTGCKNFYAEENKFFNSIFREELSLKKFDILRSIEASVRFISTEPLIGDVGTLNLDR